MPDYEGWLLVMVSVTVEKLGELAVVECEGRIVRSEAAFALRKSVTSQADARVIVLDLSEVNALEGGGLGMLMFLQRWAQAIASNSSYSIREVSCVPDSRALRGP